MLNTFCSNRLNLWGEPNPKD